MSTPRIIAACLIVVPIVMLVVGLARYRSVVRNRRKTSSLLLAAAGIILLCVLTTIASEHFLYSLMGCLILVMIKARGLGQSGDVVWARPLAMLAAAVAVVTALTSVGLHLHGFGNRAEISKVADRSLVIEAARMKVVGSLLREKLAGRKALVIVPPFENDITEAGMTGLQEGIGESFKIVAMVAPEKREEVIGEPGGMVDAAGLDAMLDERDDIDTVICLINLPYKVERMRFWKRNAKQRPEFILATGTTSRVKRLMAKQRISGAVMFTPAFATSIGQFYSMEKPLDRDQLEAFLKSNIVYIDRSNMEQIAAKYPLAFH
jgi:hypothetical protein